MASKKSQRGLSFFGLLFVLAVFGTAIAVGMRAVPTVIEYWAILKAVDKIKGEPTVPAIRAAFDRAAAVDDIQSITGKDLDISKDPTGDKVFVRFAYQRELHLAGPAYLLLKYEGSSR